MFFDEYLSVMDELRELEQGFAAYHNASVVAIYYKKYGYTKDLAELIGEEGLVKEAISAIGRFFSWLKDKIQSLCKKIWKFILKVIDWFLSLFGIQSNLSTRCEYNTNSVNLANVNKSITRVNVAIRDVFKDVRRADEMIEISYDLEFLDHIVSDKRGSYIGKAITEVRVDLSDPNGESLSLFKEKLNRNVDFLRRACDPAESGMQRYTAQEIFDVFQGVSGALCGYVAQIATMTANLAELEHLDLSKYEGVHGDRLVTDLYNQRGTKTCAPWKVGLDKDPYNLPVILRTWISYQSSIIQAQSKAIRFLQPVINDVAKAFNHNVGLIEEQFPIDGDLLRRLSGFFGHTFRISSIILTTKDPQSWVIVDKNYSRVDTSNGWCASGYDMHGTTVIYINYRNVRNTIRRHSGLITKAATKMLKDIIHECRHIYDSQTGKAFDDFRIAYDDRIQEQRAHTQLKMYLS